MDHASKDTIWSKKINKMDPRPLLPFSPAQITSSTISRHCGLLLTPQMWTCHCRCCCWKDLADLTDVKDFQLIPGLLRTGNDTMFLRQKSIRAFWNRNWTNAVNPFLFLRIEEPLYLWIGILMCAVKQKSVRWMCRVISKRLLFKSVAVEPEEFHEKFTQLKNLKTNRKRMIRCITIQGREWKNPTTQRWEAIRITLRLCEPFLCWTLYRIILLLLQYTIKGAAMEQSREGNKFLFYV